MPADDRTDWSGTLTLRLTADLAERLDRLHAQLAAEHAEVPPTRNRVGVLVLSRGLDALEREMAERRAR